MNRSSLGSLIDKLPRQIFTKAYFRANVIIFDPKLLNKNTMTGKKVKFVIVDKNRNIDIDDKIDFEFANFLIKKFKMK